MKEYEKSVIPIIESCYDDFTNVEKTIADFFISNKKEVDFSSKEIAKSLFISEASLSRFSKKIGYLGYREFIYHYQEHFMEEEVKVEEYTKEVLNTYQELLNKSYNLINNDQIKRVTKLIATKRRVYVYGMGSSGLAAQEFKMRFMRIGVDVESITDAHLLMMNSVRLDKDSLVIGISISGITKEVISAMESAREKEATTILLTSKNSSEYLLKFDEVILASVKKNLEYGNVISPQFPVLIIMDIIYANYIQEDRKNREAIYDSTLNAILDR
ncbi:MurR/RpiR family transcriptional regulator [[Clostridium] fimetarium]|uniref:DNA-binding transcriptional regulator, MurR/RpiR family, contains HTH and SIS domains n=1 Tax=[Clostridium] fimetarium TaxID=99656 RepID=A0A1I0QHZ1_9FIRM|nr:MurR/RpiR family transcriptional regulator [[Clostridium] fimetarium]SEW26488.1 DNA-binding transcriptional regulator, MurR/RpiR family, contains HTH and SIS domains [[Clostridium] fimetarium]